MSNITEDIFRTIRKCYTDGVTPETRCTSVVGNSTLESLKAEIEELLANGNGRTSSIEYASLNKMLAVCYLKMGNELEAICRLIESHAVILHQHIRHRSAKTEFRENVGGTQQAYGLKLSNINFDANHANKVNVLKSNLLELPEEWYMIQITAQYDSPDISKSIDGVATRMHAVHLTVLPTGNSRVEPLCITLPKPELQSSYDVCSEIQKLLCTNRSDLEATYMDRALYWKMRERQNTTMKAAVQALEYKWLREWRILFMADPVDNHEIVADLLQMIDKLISDSKISDIISNRTKWLLKRIVLGACFLTRVEITRAVNYVLPDHDKLARNIILSMHGKLTHMEELKSALRKTLILIVDEPMDFIPFESMEILKDHPVTRFPSLHIAYGLFKEHESTIQDGCKIIKVRKNMGTCIVNPSGNLIKMEERLKLFFQYWLPHWKSWYGVEPKREDFQDALVNHDILMYNGHGSGIEYLAGEQIEKLRVKSIVLLFGCNSVKLLSVGGRFPPFGISNQYLIASSPCILGMLWEVTDKDIDRMTADFISNWIPSPAKRPWTDVDIDAWCSGTLKFRKASTNETHNEAREPEMLRAVAKSKGVCMQYMTAAAIVVRGLPVKVV